MRDSDSGRDAGKKTLRCRSMILADVEILEGRPLLSFLNPFGQKFDVVRSGGAVDVITVSGPGQVFTKKLGSKMIALDLKGTTQDTTVSISSIAAHPGKNGPLQIGKIQVQTARLGSFQGLTTADLNGPMTPLIGPVNSLQFDALESAARIDIEGNLTTLTLNRDVNLGPTGHLNVGGNLTTFTVGGNLQTSNGGEVHVTGNLGTLSVTGDVQGKGNSDIVVGDDLSQLTVLGGGNGVPGLQGVNVVATTNILGLDIRNGIAGSKIQAGYLINGGTPGTGSNGWNIGPNVMNPAPSVDPNGQIAVLDSTIQAGFEITGLTIGGDVVSDQSNNPSGSPTRIVAGETLAGAFVPNGIIDAFQITGSLINSVVAASVGPNSTSGFYDQPAGQIAVGYLATPDAGITSLTNSTSTTTVNASTTTTTTNSNTTPGTIGSRSTTTGTAPSTSTPSSSMTTSTGTSTNIPISISPQTVTVQTAANDTGLLVSTPGNPTQLAQLQGTSLAVSTGPPFATTNDPEMSQVEPGGAINPSLAAKLQLVPPAAGAGSELPLPSKSTVLGSVLTTSPHGNRSDAAGIFAANTNGVIVGPLPTSGPVQVASSTPTGS